MTDTPELDKLKARLFHADGLGVRNFHVSWGPLAHTLTPEERAAQINKALDDVERQLLEPRNTFKTLDEEG